MDRILAIGGSLKASNFLGLFWGKLALLDTGAYWFVDDASVGRCRLWQHQPDIEIKEMFIPGQAQLDFSTERTIRKLQQKTQQFHCSARCFRLIVYHYRHRYIDSLFSFNETETITSKQKERIKLHNAGNLFTFYYLEMRQKNTFLLLASFKQFHDNITHEIQN